MKPRDKPRTKMIALSLLVPGLLLSLLLVLEFRAGAVVAILCYLAGLVASLFGAGFHCQDY